MQASLNNFLPVSLTFVQVQVSQTRELYHQAEELIILPALEAAGFSPIYRHYRSAVLKIQKD